MLTIANRKKLATFLEEFSDASDTARAAITASIRGEEPTAIEIDSDESGVTDATDSLLPYLEGVVDQPLMEDVRSRLDRTADLYGDEDGDDDDDVPIDDDDDE